MKRLIEFPLKDGGSILVEVEPGAGEGLIPAAAPGEISVKATQTFEDAIDRVRPAAAAVVAKLRDFLDPPDEIEVEFGIKMNAKLGAVVASAEAEANYKVTLTWKHESQKNQTTSY